MTEHKMNQHVFANFAMTQVTFKAKLYKQSQVLSLSICSLSLCSIIVYFGRFRLLGNQFLIVF